MVDFLTKLLIIWLGLDVIILATTWYLTTTIRPLFPDWWRRVIADNDPYDRPEVQLQAAYITVDYAERLYRGARSGSYQSAPRKLKHPTFTTYDPRR